MLTRRSLVLGVLMAPIAVAGGSVARVRKADARRPRRAARVPGKVYARGAGARGASATPLKTLGGGVFSVTNANDAYVAVMQLEFQPKDGPVMALKAGELGAESWGSGFGDSGSGKGSASWRLDRAKADEVAALWRVTRRDRVPLGAGLVGRWKPKGPFVVGKKMEIVLTLENGGTAPVWFNTGGRQRGARDNRFLFGVKLGGDALPVVDAPDFGGIGSIQPLEPGRTVERSEDLGRWVTIAKPGTYQVSCRYELELTTGTHGGGWPDHGNEIWDWATDDVIDVRVG